MRKLTITLAAVAFTAVTALVAPVRAVDLTTDAPTLVEYRLPQATLSALRARWLDRLRATHADGTWAQLKVALDDADLAAMGLPTAQTMKNDRERADRENGGGARKVREDRSTEPATGLTFAGTGWFGIRPGAWLLVSTGDGTSLCSAAHVYGSPGGYRISTAGHCGEVGDIVTMVGAVQQGDTIYPLLVDIGRFSVSHVSGTRDDGSDDKSLGEDWGLVDVFPSMQGLVSPTLAFWGGPQGMFTASGDALPAQIVHYGHGLVLGTGGTPRTGTALTWGSDQFTFFGAITPGDSGSAANVIAPTLGAVNAAGGIITHIWVDSSFEEGFGIMGGTRATIVSGALANGDLVASPVP